MANTVLIVQGDVESLLTLVRIFEERGDRVFTASTIHPVDDKIRKHKPNMVVMDVDLLDGGWSRTLSQNARRYPGVKILYTANRPGMLRSKRYKDLVKYNVLTPPFTLEKLELSLLPSLQRTVPKRKDVEDATESEEISEATTAPVPDDLAEEPTQELPDDLPDVKVDEAVEIGALDAQITEPSPRKKAIAIKEKPIERRGSRVRVPVRFKITMPFVILVLLLAVIGVFMGAQVYFESVEERFTNQLIENGRLSAEWVVREEDRLLETMRLISNTQGIAEALYMQDAEILRNLVFPITVNAMEEAVEILDLQGTSMISMRHRTGGNMEDYEFSRGETAYLYWEFVQRILLSQVDALGDKFAGFVQADWGDYLYVAGPIFDTERDLVGVVLVGKSLATLVREIRQATLAQVTVYSVQGEALATTFLDEPSLSAEIAESVLANQNSESPIRVIESTHIGYGEILGPLELRAGEDHAVIGSAIPQNFILSTSMTLRMQIVGYSVIGILLIIVVGLYLSARITKPLMDVVNASTAVARGDLKVHVEPQGNDEIATLAHTFNRMVSAMRSSNTRLMSAYESTLEGWSKALELRDQDTDGHTRRVTQMTLALAKSMGINSRKLRHIRRGAILHDIGKMGIPDSILTKPGPLSEQEWEVMRMHPVFAYEMLWPIEHLHQALPIPCCHHERWDGTGYPLGLAGEAIPLEARIFAVIDVWDALRTDRPYRKAWKEEEALEYIQSAIGTHFDPKVVKSFLVNFRKPEFNAFDVAEEEPEQIGTLPDYLYQIIQKSTQASLGD